MHVIAFMFTFTLTSYFPQMCKPYFLIGPINQMPGFSGSRPGLKMILHNFSNSIVDYEKTVSPVIGCFFLNIMSRKTNGNLNLCWWRE